MRTFTTLLILFAFTISSYSQSIVKLTFLDNCTAKPLNLEYELSPITNEDAKSIIVRDSAFIEPGAYLISVSLERNSYKCFWDLYKIIEENKVYNDTIELTKIALCNDGSLDSKYWKFHFCDRLCNEHEVDYYTNGLISVEGYFVNGWPKRKVKFYDKNGVLTKTEIYTKKGLLRIK